MHWSLIITNSKDITQIPILYPLSRLHFDGIGIPLHFFSLFTPLLPSKLYVIYFNFTSILTLFNLYTNSLTTVGRGGGENLKYLDGASTSSGYISIYIYIIELPKSRWIMFMCGCWLIYILLSFIIEFIYI